MDVVDASKALQSIGVLVEFAVIQRLPLLTVSNGRAHEPSDKADRRNTGSCSRWHTLTRPLRKRRTRTPRGSVTGGNAAGFADRSLAGRPLVSIHNALRWSHGARYPRSDGGQRDDYGTEFGSTNVAIHAVSIAVELGDAGQAIELGQQVNPSRLSPERQARYFLDVAQAHTMRRQIGEALHALQEAERIASEETRVHAVGRAVTRDLLQLSGLRPRPELRELAERFGVLP
jgi:hypothetical protein